MSYNKYEELAQRISHKLLICYYAFHFVFLLSLRTKVVILGRSFICFTL